MKANKYPGPNKRQRIWWLLARLGEVWQAGGHERRLRKLRARFLWKVRNMLKGRMK